MVQPSDCSAHYTPTSPDSGSPRGQGLCEGPAATSPSAETLPETCTETSGDMRLLPPQNGATLLSTPQDPP